MSDELNASIESVEPVEPVEEVTGTAERVMARDVSVHDSLVGMVQAAGSATVSDAACGGVVAGQGMQIDNGFCQAVVAGAGIEMRNSGGGVMVAGNDIEMVDSTSGILYSQQATIENSTIGVLLAPRAALGENVKVIATTRQAITFGAAFGLAAGLLGWLLRRRR